jgi:hypothetical protein
LGWLAPTSFNLSEKKMDKKKAKKQIYQIYFHGTNKYTNGSVFFVLVLFPAEM